MKWDYHLNPSRKVVGGPASGGTQSALGLESHPHPVEEEVRITRQGLWMLVLLLCCRNTTVEYKPGWLLEPSTDPFGAASSTSSSSQLSSPSAPPLVPHVSQSTQFPLFRAVFWSGLTTSAFPLLLLGMPPASHFPSTSLLSASSFLPGSCPISYRAVQPAANSLPL